MFHQASRFTVYFSFRCSKRYVLTSSIFEIDSSAAVLASYDSTECATSLSGWGGEYLIFEAIDKTLHLGELLDGTLSKSRLTGFYSQVFC
jgi:hypothetical protein